MHDSRQPTKGTGRSNTYAVGRDGAELSAPKPVRNPDTVPRVIRPAIRAAVRATLAP
jgi:hypothetical protein